MELLVIGAGPYGLATAAEARRRGIDTTVVGEPMAFWRRHMPGGMLLRSGREWHLDAAGVHTFDAYVEDRGLERAAFDPIPVEAFIGYADWFAAREGIVPLRRRVTDVGIEEGRLVARMEDGLVLAADRVVAAPGIAAFAVTPPLVERLAPDQWSHTVSTVDFAGLRGRRVLIVGGRQSAFEWAALLGETGAERVDVVHRHDTPQFTASDWSFVDEMLAETRRARGWFRSLPDASRAAIAQRFWQVGRLQLEPWLEPRIAGAHLHPRTEIADLQPGPPISARLTDGTRIEADHLLLATGYAADLRRVPYLPPIDLADGFPVLDPDFQSSVPGLYIPGFPSTRDFGPFFGFVAGATTTATIIGKALSAG
jgi:cation diffusion facilitator CzcD-associated flavoprotein CzcO